MIFNQKVRSLDSPEFCNTSLDSSLAAYPLSFVTLMLGAVMFAQCVRLR
jgi:hypothetical protein